MNRLPNPTAKFNGKPTRQFGARLSPRRKLYLQRLLDFLKWHGRKVLFDEGKYLDIEHEQNLDRFGTNQAIDDGFALGLVDCTMAGGRQLVLLLSDRLEDAA